MQVPLLFCDEDEVAEDVAEGRPPFVEVDEVVEESDDVDEVAGTDPVTGCKLVTEWAGMTSPDGVELRTATIPEIPHDQSGFKRRG